MTLLQLTPLLTDSIASKQSEAKTLSSVSLDDFLSKLISGMVDFAIHLAIAIVVFYVGKFIINKIHKAVGTILARRHVERSLVTFILSLIRMVLYFIVIVTVIDILGIETTSFLALFASAGVALGMALSGTLQNFAGGVLILLLKPYKIGDYIEAQGYSGTVTEIQIFHTIINTPDNKSILIPNGGLSTGSVNNWSREDYRRVDWSVSIAYGDDVEKARQVILDLFKTDSRIVKKYLDDDRRMRRKKQAEAVGTDIAGQEQTARVRWWNRLLRRHRMKIKEAMEANPRSLDAKDFVSTPKVNCAPTVNLDKMSDSSIDLVVRAWTRSEYFWPVYYQMNELIYNELPKHGINFPFPQMDIHLPPKQ